MQVLRRPAPRSDVEHVERVRRAIARFERVRPWLLRLHIVGAVLLVGGSLLLLLVLQRRAQPGENRATFLGLAAGVNLGGWIGLLGSSIGHGIALTPLRCPDRAVVLAVAQSAPAYTSDCSAKEPIGCAQQVQAC